MTARTKVWVFTLVGLLLFLIATWVLGAVFGLSGRDYWILGLGLTLLGTVASAVLLWYLLTEKYPKPKGPPPESQDIDAVIDASRARLASAQFAERRDLRRLPVVIWMGLEGSAKTTTMTRSGMEADLLAGEVVQGDTPPPTRVLNIWYHNKTAFLEVGGRLLADEARWVHVVRHLQPSRLGAAMSGGSQASRVAVVCVSSEELLRADRAQALPAIAAMLRNRLADLSSRLGIRLPVYVVFTKADKIPHFADYTRSFSNDEVKEPFGATLRFDPGAAGSYADRTFQRVNQELDRLFLSLASRRLSILPRESQAEIVGGAYEFPREFRKVVPSVAQFLVDLSKPSQLGVSPFLRGFYFTGVRAVLVHDAAPAAPSASAGQAPSLAASQVFSAVHLQAAAPAPTPGTSRRVPQWVFLEPILREIVLRDRTAMAITSGGRRVDTLRRALLASVAGIAVFLSLGFFTSFIGNRRMASRVRTAAVSVAQSPTTDPDLPPMETLQRLDTLRGQVERLKGFQRGTPMRLEWGLYVGDRLYPAARRAYFKEFDRLMFGPTRASVTQALTALPDAPVESSDYTATLDLLKTYLVTTAHNDRAETEFLTTRLTRYWTRGRPVDSARASVAARQFAFYAGELAAENPFPAEVDGRLVEHTRSFLRQFAGTKRIYEYMLAEAAKQNPAVRLTDATGIVANTYEVPGAFTAGGWRFVQEGLRNVQRFFQGEPWVLGDQGPGAQDPVRVGNDLRSLYRADFVRHWRSFVNGARVPGFSGVADAARKLTTLSGNQSPLFQALQIAARNTVVDSQLAATVFQPLHLLTAAAGGDKLVTEAGDPYVSGLVTLQTSLDQVAAAPAGQGSAAVAKAVSDVGNAKVAARQLAQKFTTDTASVAPAVQRLLLEPVNSVERLLSGFGAAGLNRQGRDFCGPVRTLFTKAPFALGARDATLDEVTAQFQRGTGALWMFFNDALQQSLVQQGGRYASKPGTDLPLTAAFVEFFNRAAGFSTAIFPEGASGPRLAFTLRPLLSDNVPGVTVSIDGRTVNYTRTSAAMQPFTWNAAEARDARVTAQVGGAEVSLSFSGTWALFRLFQAADNWTTEGFTQRGLWTLGQSGQQVRLPFELNLGGAPPIFQRGYFSGATCAGDIAR